jgi:hypothetical protein
MTPISDLERLISLYRLDCSENLVCDKGIRNRMSDILKESSNPDIIATLAHSN